MSTSASADIAALRQIPRFAGLSDKASEWLSSRISARAFGAGEILFLEDEPCEHLYVVYSGAIKVYKSLDSGRELILDIFGFGEAVGEVALIDRAGYPASAAAQEDSIVYVMAARDYFHLIEAYPDATLALVRDLTLRMRSLSRRVKDLGGGGVDFRIATALLQFSKNEEVSGGGIPVPIPLSRRDIADLVGARIETVIRIMSKWGKDGYIRTENGRITILNRPALKRIVRPG